MAAVALLTVVMTAATILHGRGDRLYQFDDRRGTRGRRCAPEGTLAARRTPDRRARGDRAGRGSRPPGNLLCEHVWCGCGRGDPAAADAGVRGGGGVGGGGRGHRWLPAGCGNFALKWPNDLLRRMGRSSPASCSSDIGRSRSWSGFGVNLAKRHPLGLARSRHDEPGRQPGGAAAPEHFLRFWNGLPPRSRRWLGRSGASDGLSPIRDRAGWRVPIAMRHAAHRPHCHPAKRIDRACSTGSLPMVRCCLRLADEWGRACHPRRRRLPDLNLLTGPAMLLAIDAGNTNIVFALIDGRRISARAGGSRPTRGGRRTNMRSGCTSCSRSRALRPPISIDRRDHRDGGAARAPQSCGAQPANISRP